MSSQLPTFNALFTGLPTNTISGLLTILTLTLITQTYTKRSAQMLHTLFKLHWLLISYRIQYKTLLLIYKALHVYASGYLTELFLPYTFTHVLRSSGSSLLIIPRVRLSSTGDRTFSVFAPK